MAGHARRNKALTELEVRASKAGMEPLEWLEEYLENGGNFVKLAESFTLHCGLDITRSILDRMAEALASDAKERIRAARAKGAHAQVETQTERIDKLGLDKDEIARERLRMSNTQWVAGRANKAEFGDAPAVGINMSFASLHLDTLRRLSAEDSKRLASQPEQLTGGDPLGHNITEGDYEIITEDPESLL